MQQKLQNRKSVILISIKNIAEKIKCGNFTRFANHENSKKHKENVAAIKASMQEEEDDFLGEEEEESEESDVGEAAEMKQELTDAEKAGYTLLKEDDDGEDLKEDEDEETEDGKVI